MQRMLCAFHGPSSFVPNEARVDPQSTIFLQTSSHPNEKSKLRTGKKRTQNPRLSHDTRIKCNQSKTI